MEPLGADVTRHVARVPTVGARLPLVMGPMDYSTARGYRVFTGQPQNAVDELRDVAGPVQRTAVGQSSSARLRTRPMIIDVLIDGVDGIVWKMPRSIGTR